MHLEYFTLPFILLLELNSQRFLESAPRGSIGDFFLRGKFSDIFIP